MVSWSTKAESSSLAFFEMDDFQSVMYNLTYSIEHQKLIKELLIS
jgi:hypothetical protein